MVQQLLVGGGFLHLRAPGDHQGVDGRLDVGDGRGGELETAAGEHRPPGGGDDVGAVPRGRQEPRGAGEHLQGARDVEDLRLGERDDDDARAAHPGSVKRLRRGRDRQPRVLVARRRCPQAEVVKVAEVLRPTGAVPEGRTRWIVAGSLATGLLAGLALVAAPFVPAQEDAVTGALLCGFAVGWALVAALSARYTAPQR